MCVFNILSMNQKSFNITKVYIPRLWVFRNNDNRILFSLENSIDTHFFLFTFIALASWICLNYFQQTFKRFMRTAKTSSFRTCRPFKFIDKFNDLQLKGQYLAFDFFSEIALSFESNCRLISFVCITLHGEF